MNLPARPNRAARLTSILGLSGAVLLASAAVANAGWSQRGADMVMINPGGAERLSGADGIRIQLNSGPNYKAFPLTGWAVYEGGDQVYFSRRQFWNTSTAGPSLQIGGAQANGGVLVGNAGPAAGFPSLNASD